MKSFYHSNESFTSQSRPKYGSFTSRLREIRSHLTLLILILTVFSSNVWGEDITIYVIGDIFVGNSSNSKQWDNATSTIKVDVRYKGTEGNFNDGDVYWAQEMTNTGYTYLGYPIYSYTGTPTYGGFQYRFKHYKNDIWQEDYTTAWYSGTDKMYRGFYLGSHQWVDYSSTIYPIYLDTHNTLSGSKKWSADGATFSMKIGSTEVFGIQVKNNDGYTVSDLYSFSCTTASPSAITFDRKNETGSTTWNTIKDVDFSSSYNCYEVTDWGAASASYNVNEVSEPNYIYFDNSLFDLNKTNKYFVIGHDKPTAHSNTHGLSTITNTKLLYVNNTTENWRDATYYAFIGNTATFGSGDWGSSNIEDAEQYTAAYEGRYDLKDGEISLFVPASGSNGATITPTDMGTAASSLNNTQTVQYALSTDGGATFSAMSSGTVPGKLEISAYKFADGTYNSVSNSKNKQTITAGSSGTYSTSVPAAYTGETTLDKSQSAGYEFIGWYDAVNGGSEVSSPFYPTSAQTVYARYKTKTWSITYKDNGNVAFTGAHVPDKVATHTYLAETSLNKASKSGYVFDGWYKESDCSGTVKTSIGATEFTAAPTLYAKWTAMSLTALANNTLYKAEDMVVDGLTISTTEYLRAGVSANNRFNLLGTGTSNAAAGPMGAQDVKSGSADVTIDGTDFANTLLFKGISNRGGEAETDLPTSRAIQFEVPVTGTLEIYCYYPSHISLIKSGSSAAAIGTGTTTESKETIEVTAGTYYIFANGTGAKLYGLRFKNTYTVTAAVNNGSYGSASAGDAKLWEGSTTTITASPNSGYQVNSWAVSGTGASISPSGASHSTTTTLTMGTANATVTATLGTISYSITYNLNGGDNHGDNPASYTIESSTITLEDPTKAGYRFDGWYDNSLFTGDPVTSIASGSTGNKEYWAKWVHSITYHSAMDEDSVVIVEHGDDIEDTYIPSNCAADRVFVGWATSEVAVQQTEPSIETEDGTLDDVTENKDLYAVFVSKNGSGGHDYVENFDSYPDAGSSTPNEKPKTYGIWSAVYAQTNNSSTVTDKMGSQAIIMQTTSATMTTTKKIHNFTGLTCQVATTHTSVYFQIEYSEDGSDWTALQSSTSHGSTRTKTSYTLSVVGDPVDAFVRFKITAADGDGASYRIFIDDVTLYSKPHDWILTDYATTCDKPASVTVTFDKVGGTGDVPSSPATGGSITLPTLTKTRYRFDGFTAQATGQSVAPGIYYAGESFLVNHNVTLTAQWTELLEEISGVSPITSGKDIAVRAIEVDSIVVDGTSAATPTVNKSGTDAALFTVTVDAANKREDAVAGKTHFPYTVTYTPTEHNVLNEATISFSWEGATTNEITVQGRSLPEEFVIATRKRDGTWVALPNNLKGTLGEQTDIVPVTIHMDNASSPTSVLYAPSTIVFKTAAKKNSFHVNSLRFTKAGGGYLYSTSSNNKFCMQTNNYDDEDWTLKSSDLQVYEIAHDPSTSPTRKMGLYNSFANFGHPTSPDTADIYLLPATSGFGLTISYDATTRNIPFHQTTTDSIWETAVLDGSSLAYLTSAQVSGTFKVRLATSTPGSYVDCAQSASENAAAIDARKLGSFTLAADTRGRFQIFINRTTSNFGLRWVPTENHTLRANDWDGVYGDGDKWSLGRKPTIDDDVYIEHSTVIYKPNAKAKSIRINKPSDSTIRLSIESRGGLVVAEDIKAKHTAEGAYEATKKEDLQIRTDDGGNGGLICGNASDDTEAEYVHYIKAQKFTYNEHSWYINQYLGIPFVEIDAYKYYGFNIFQYDDGADDWRTPEGTELQPFTCYNFIRKYTDYWNSFYVEGVLNLPGTTDSITTLKCGTRTGTATPSIDETEGHQDYMFANSWTAPISIKALTAADCSGVSGADLIHTIYIFNAGFVDPKGDTQKQYGNLAGQWSSYSFSSAAHQDSAFISATQAFMVTATTTNAKLNLDYKKHVYDPAVAEGVDSINTLPTRAPRRTKKATDPVKLKMIIRSDEYVADVLYLFEREDFTPAFDNGWDGYKIMGETFAPQLYAFSGESRLAIDAVPELDETEIGFKAGTQANEYTFSFEYNDEEPLYLYDKDTQEFTEITNESTYSFVTSDRKEHARFILTRSNVPQSPTGVEEVENETVQRAEKFMKDQQIFIRRGERTYSITGARVR